MASVPATPPLDKVTLLLIWPLPKSRPPWTRTELLVNWPLTASEPGADRGRAAIGARCRRGSGWPGRCSSSRGARAAVIAPMNVLLVELV